MQNKRKNFLSYFGVPTYGEGGPPVGPKSRFYQKKIVWRLPWLICVTKNLQNARKILHHKKKKYVCGEDDWEAKWCWRGQTWQQCALQDDGPPHTQPWTLDNPSLIPVWLVRFFYDYSQNWVYYSSMLLMHKLNRSSWRWVIRPGHFPHECFFTPVCLNVSRDCHFHTGLTFHTFDWHLDATTNGQSNVIFSITPSLMKK